MAFFSLLLKCHFGISIGMETFASALINALGGTAQVAELSDAPMSTIHNMRRCLTGSRLNHLRRIAAMEGLAERVDEVARQHGVELPPLARRIAGRDQHHSQVDAA